MLPQNLACFVLAALELTAEAHEQGPHCDHVPEHLDVGAVSQSAHQKWEATTVYESRERGRNLRN